MRPLLIDRHDDGVVVLTLNLPDRRNAMTADLTAAWAETVPALAADRSVRCVLLTAAGTAFCAGGDLSWLERGDTRSVDDLRARMLPFYRTWLAIREVEAPTIAVVQGPAVGAGLALALACDLRYAAPDAALSMPFTALGIHPGMASTWLLPEVAGLPVARELLLTGRVVTGAEAVGLGLVNRVFPAGTLAAEALAIARQVASRAPVPTRLTKVALAGGGPATFEAALAWEAVAQPVTLAGADLAEGLRAARERRPPRFTGR
ncbi:MAG TPA: enoyl-CoA hydratase-related protein [Mycobacteriales bacterium]|nr:enoyl-CoA hydratase-related protein [Mycobacteriales bacterium]